MIPRFYNLSKSRSFFLFGPRGVGKSTLLRNHFSDYKPFVVNLLESDVERKFASHPERLLAEWKGQSQEVKDSKWIVIDEVQRIPRILDVAHRGIEEFRLNFALTGSSARKLRKGAANLLAGRASEFRLHPFSFGELGANFSLNDALTWGAMPQSHILRLDLIERRRYLNAYVNTYLREEIQAEQIVRNMEPFRQFLEVAAQSNGKILNASKIGRQCGIDPKTSQRYFEVLVDTLVGFYLPAFDGSIRKQQASHPKFYWFDLGVANAAAGRLDETIQPGTFEYGNSFENLVVLEAIKLNDSTESFAKLMYFRSADDAEIDLIIKIGKKIFAVEIKSCVDPDVTEIRKLARICRDLPKSTEPMILCNIERAYVEEGVRIVNWKTGLAAIFSARTP